MRAITLSGKAEREQSHGQREADADNRYAGDRGGERGDHLAACDGRAPAGGVGRETHLSMLWPIVAAARPFSTAKGRDGQDKVLRKAPALSTVNVTARQAKRGRWR